MPIVSSELRAGDPTITSTGKRSGTIDFTFADGRIITRNVRAQDATAWAQLLIDLPAQVEKDIEILDAQEVAETDNAIASYKDAPIKRVALAYLRRAYSTGDPYRAYVKFERFNDYRVAQGWTVNQVVTNLAEVGLTDDEWTEMRDRYQYLSETGRVTSMVAFQAVLDGDTWGAEFRE